MVSHKSEIIPTWGWDAAQQLGPDPACILALERKKETVLIPLQTLPHSTLHPSTKAAVVGDLFVLPIPHLSPKHSSLCYSG